MKKQPIKPIRIREVKSPEKTMPYITYPGFKEITQRDNFYFSKESIVYEDPEVIKPEMIYPRYRLKFKGKEYVMIVYRPYFGTYIYERPLGGKVTKTYFFSKLERGHLDFVDKIIEDMIRMIKSGLKKNEFEVLPYGFRSEIAMVTPKEFSPLVGFFIRRKGGTAWRLVSWGFLVKKRYGEIEITPMAREKKIYVWY